MRAVPKSIARPDYAETGISKDEMRLSRTKIDILDAKGQEAMRKVCKLAREVLDTVAAELKPGVTTDYLDEICHKACIEREVSVTPRGSLHCSKCSLTMTISNLDSHIPLP